MWAHEWEWSQKKLPRRCARDESWRGAGVTSETGKGDEEVRHSGQRRPVQRHGALKEHRGPRFGTLRAEGDGQSWGWRGRQGQVSGTLGGLLAAIYMQSARALSRRPWGGYWCGSSTGGRETGLMRLQRIILSLLSGGFRMPMEARLDPKDI